VSRGIFCNNFDEKKLKLEEQRIKIIRIDDLELNPMKETSKQLKKIKNFLTPLDHDLVDLKKMGLLCDDRLINLVNYVFWPRGFVPKNVKNHN
jgi:hypothetical protein